MLVPYKFITYIISFALCVRGFVEAKKAGMVINGIIIFVLFIMPPLFPTLFLFDKTGLVLLNARIVAAIGNYLFLRIRRVSIR